MLQSVDSPAWAVSSDELPVSVVIPIYNEQLILKENLQTLAQFFDRLLGTGSWLFILVDNGSTDGTPRLVEEAIERWPLSRGIRLADPNYGAALKTGLRVATTKWVFVVDIEQWDIPFMTWAWANRTSYDMFMASKRADPTINFQEPHRRLLSAGLNAMLQVLFGFSGTDTHGPKLLNRESLETMIQACVLDRGQFDTELVLRAIRGAKSVVEVPIEYRESRPHRNWMFKKIVWNLLALRRLRRVMQGVPFEGYVLYYRFSRKDVLATNPPAVADLMEQVRV
jgi:glycosyltransferase involved in cell wall biosynthesis